MRAMRSLVLFLFCALLSHASFAQATALTVTDIAANRVVQRDIAATTKGLALSGTYTGSPSGIKCEVDIVGGGTALAAVAMTGYTHSGGNWSGTCPGVPQGAWYTIKVIDSLNASITASGSNSWGVGVDVCTLGQSNMNQLPALGTSATPATYTAANDGEGAAWVATNATIFGTGGGYAVLANTVQATLGGTIPVGIIAAAVNGSSIGNWLTAANGGDHVAWGPFVTKLNTAGGDCEIVLFQQGETNAVGGQSGVNLPSAYYAGLGLLQAQLATQLSRSSAQFKFGVASIGPGGSSAFIDADATTIRTAQITYGLNVNGAFYMGSMYDMILTVGEQLHYNANSADRAAWRYAKSIAAALGLASFGAQGPSIATASWPVGSSTITLGLTMSGATALRDGAGNANCSSNAGAGFGLSGTSATISSVVCGTNTITLTTSAARQNADVPLLAYANGGNPFNQISNGSANDNSVIYDNNGAAIGSGTGITDLGWPLQPTQGAMAVSANLSGARRMFH